MKTYVTVSDIDLQIRESKNNLYRQNTGCFTSSCMSPQDWAQIAFRSEMHSNGFNNESGG